jgi:hypothetical protein
VRIGSGEVEPVLIHAQAAVTDVITFGNTLVMPDLPAIASVDGPNVVRRGEVENAVDFEGSGFDGGHVCREYPGER